jgi:hypothetical protein
MGGQSSQAAAISNLARVMAIRPGSCGSRDFRLRVIFGFPS